MRVALALCVAFLTVAGAPVHAGEAPAGLTLDRIMADPDWIGPPIESPYWSTDGAAVYYQLKRSGSPVRDLHRVDVGSGADSVVADTELANVDAADAVFDRAHARAVFVRNGDVFVRDLASRRLQQVTRTDHEEAAPRFSADERSVQYRIGNDWFAHDVASGVNAPLVLLKAEKDPDADKPDDFAKLQLRLIATLKRDHDDKRTLKDRAEQQRRADPTRAASPIYLGDDVTIVDAVVSPDGRWALVVTAPKGHEAGRAGKMPVYVTESGYEEVEDVRTRVGRGELTPHSLLRVDLATRKVDPVDIKVLAGIHDDPLSSVRAENEKAARARDKAEADSTKSGADKSDADAGATKDKAKKAKDDGKDKADAKSKDADARALQVAGIEFARDGAHAAVVLRANDNKDRWIASIASDGKLHGEHRLTDAAWINWNFNEFGWLPDGKTLWYVSEHTGFAHLYVKPLDGKARALTSGRFEVSAPEASADGKTFFVRANPEAPYVYDVYRVATAGGALERVSRFKGIGSFALSPDGKSVLVAHSSSYQPMQVGVVGADGSNARALTDTRTSDYKAITWQQPEIVAVPSTHGIGTIWGKFYKPSAAATGKRPIVMFVHGAGYTQNTHLSFPYYYREQMFHNLLTERGYLVLDLDYRASEGYGRDWRTAIYRQMGTPELEDLIDGVHWLVEKHGGDPQRVGLYGGSYGGFMTLMAMFRAPDTFKAGAALRPVTDWTQYNHEYTSDILNTPQVDDIAYRRSSPIEFADGLKGPLLIAHGMMDDNVFFQDSVRLFQRLIELHKDDVELAPYPLERHSFSHADAWRDEYARILKLFETHLK